MDGNRPEQTLYETSAAAKELGLARKSLNRLAPAYERVHGKLPRGPRHVRLWTPEAIARIRSARLAVEEGHAVNIEAALRGFEPRSTSEHQGFGAQSSRVPARSSEGTPEARPPSRLLEALVGELHALREAVEDQNKLLRAQSHRLQRLEVAAPLRHITPADPSEKEAVLDPSEKPESSAEDQEDVETPRRTSTDRRVSGVILPIMLVAASIAVTIVSALYDNALLLTVSLTVAAISFLFSWYYYYYAKG